MFIIERKDGAKFTGNVFDSNGTQLNTSLDIEKACKTSEYLVINGEDDARVPCEDIRSYARVKEPQSDFFI
jgi:ornithine carbamoyltransferase